jgi:hypothetical protein
MFKPAPRTPIPAVLIEPITGIYTPLLKSKPVIGKLSSYLFNFFFYGASARRSFFIVILSVKGFDFSLKSILNTADLVFQDNDEIFRVSRHFYYSPIFLYLLGIWLLGKIYHFRVRSVERAWAEFDLVPEPNACLTRRVRSGSD